MAILYFLIDLSEGSEEIELQELQTIKNPNPIDYDSSPKKPKQKDVGNVYKTFLITNPANGSGLRNNSGNVTISVSLEPSLRSGHSIVITMDGKEISKGSSSSASVESVDREAHSIAASVVSSVSSEGKKLISTSSNFSLLRASQ